MVVRISPLLQTKVYENLSYLYYPQKPPLLFGTFGPTYLRVQSQICEP